MSSEQEPSTVYLGPDDAERAVTVTSRVRGLTVLRVDAGVLDAVVAAAARGEGPISVDERDEAMVIEELPSLENMIALLLDAGEIDQETADRFLADGPQFTELEILALMRKVL